MLSLKTNIHYNKGIIRIEIENTYSEHVSRKEDGQEYGLGLMIVRETVQKLGGELICRKEDGLFCVKAFFYDGKERMEEDEVQVSETNIVP